MKKTFLVVFIILVLMFWSFLTFKRLIITWNSMSPSVKQWEIVLIQTMGYWKLERWDIILFELEGKTEPYLKRIIWLPWETVKIEWWQVQICKNNQCNILEEDYLLSWILTNLVPQDTPNFSLTNWYFVMWDNRSWSSDSRDCFSLECNTNDSTYEIQPEKIIGKTIHIWNK